MNGINTPHQNGNKLSSGSIEFLKWIGIITMLFDHVNHFLFNSGNEFYLMLGRIPFPIFIFLIAYNFADPNAYKRNLHRRVINKLLIYGALAAPAMLMLYNNGTWPEVDIFSVGDVISTVLPLNIMFTLAATVFILYLWEQENQPKSERFKGLAYIKVGAFILLPAFAEYWHVAVIFALGVWYYFSVKKIVWAFWVCLLVAFGGYYFLFADIVFWSLLAAPIIFLAFKYEFKLPRSRNFFYIFYPLHLWLLVGLQQGL